jgi:opacity protein-like surface antigen
LGLLAKVSFPALTFGFVSFLGLSPQASAQQLASNTSEVSSSAAIELPDAPETKASTQSTPAKKKTVNVSEINFAIGVTTQLTATRTANKLGSQYIQGTTPSAGLLATFHQQIRPLVGYNINFGFNKLIENYQSQTGITNPGSGVTSGSYARGSIEANVFEISSAYVVKRHQLGSRFEPFADAGAGVLIFSPTIAPFSGHSSYRAAFLFGGGVDYRINTHLGLRAEYRGLLYKYPDFAAVTSTVPVSKFFTVTSEPTISFRYRFGYHQGMR